MTTEPRSIYCTACTTLSVYILQVTQATNEPSVPTYRLQNEVNVAAKKLGNEFSFCCLHGIVPFSVVAKVQCEAVGGGSPATHTGELPSLEDLGERR